MSGNMRASDIIRGKIQSLRNSVLKERSLGNGCEADVATGENAEASYASRDFGNRHPDLPVKQDGIPEKREATNPDDEGSSGHEMPYPLKEFMRRKNQPAFNVSVPTPMDHDPPEQKNHLNKAQEAQVAEPMKQNISDGAPVSPIVTAEAPDEQSRQHIKELYQKAQTYLHDLRDKARSGEPINIDPAMEIIQSVIDIHYDMDQEIYQISLELERGDDYFFSHALNTTIYTVRMGQRLGYSSSELLSLGLAAFLCDIGMFKIPDSILNKQGKLSQDEIDIIKSHPRLSRDILMPFQKDYPTVVEAVFEHQERENGQGYPRGLKGREISDNAKIIGICDSYEAMTHNRPHKRALMQTDSIRELIGSKDQLFSPRIIKTFLDEISIFPMGSYVRLNNKNIGHVIATNRSNPLKPTVKILWDETGKRFAEPKIINLKENPVLNVEGSVAQDELPR